jgi:hypothetical protein
MYMVLANPTHVHSSAHDCCAGGRAPAAHILQTARARDVVCCNMWGVVFTACAVFSFSFSIPNSMCTWRGVPQHVAETVPQHVAPCGTMWHHVALCGNTWHHVAPCGTMWHHVATCGCNMCRNMWLQHVPQHVAPCGTMWHHVAAPCGNMWHHVAAPCGCTMWLQHVVATVQCQAGRSASGEPSFSMFASWNGGELFTRVGHNCSE